MSVTNHLSELTRYMPNEYILKTIHRVVILLCLINPIAVNAHDFNYDYIEIGYGTGTDDSLGVDIDSTLKTLSVSYEVLDGAVLTGGYVESDAKDFFANVEILSFGITLHNDINQANDVFFNLSAINILDIEPRTANSEDGESGFAATLGIRNAVNDALELNASISHSRVISNTYINEFGIGIRYNLSKSASIGISYASSKDTDATLGDVRFQF